MKKRIFYRVSNTETNQGLWYNIDGEFTGLIHDKFKFCVNSELPMPFDENVIGYLSCTDKLKELWNWFPKDDIKQLEPHGYFLHEYESKDYKEYENHWIFNQHEAKLIRKIPMEGIDVEEKLIELQNKIEVQSKDITGLKETVEWLERNI